MQQVLYEHFLASKATKKLIDAGKKGTAGVLSAITSLKKLCNHPKLIFDALNTNKDQVKGKGKGGEGELAAGFKGVGELFPPGLFEAGRGRSVESWMALGGKMAVLSRLLHLLRTETKDRIVIVSNYTQTLDLISLLCRERNYPVLRLDGSTGMSKRQKLVKEFCDLSQNQFVFLLSSKAGGCGLNLVGGNRLVLFDPDWNPATDKQAAGRVWRDGQKKKCYVYRFLSTGTIEEKVFQRQISKEGLQSLVSKNGKATASVMSESELKELFQLSIDTLSNTFELMCQLEVPGPDDAGGSSGSIFKAQVGKPTEENMQDWGHHSLMESVPDDVLKRAACGDISFVFTCEVEGKLPMTADAPPPPPQPNKFASSSSSLPSTSFKPPLPPPPLAAAALTSKIQLPPPTTSVATASKTQLPPPFKSGKENLQMAAGPSSKRSIPLASQRDSASRTKRTAESLDAYGRSVRPKASEVIEIDSSSGDEEGSEEEDSMSEGDSDEEEREESESEDS